MEDKDIFYLVNCNTLFGSIRTESKIKLGRFGSLRTLHLILNLIFESMLLLKHVSGRTDLSSCEF